MNKTTTVSALFLAGAMLLSNIEVRAEEAAAPAIAAVKGFDTTSKFILAATSVIIAGWASLYSRKSEKEFKTRYSAEKTRKISRMLTKDYVNNLWYFLVDEVVGQRKQSSSLKAKSDGKIYPSEETPAYGLLGSIDAYAAPLAESAKKFIEPFTQAGLLWMFVSKFAKERTFASATTAPKAPQG